MCRADLQLYQEMYVEQTFQFEQVDYNTAELSAEALQLYKKLNDTQNIIKEKKDNTALLHKAKNAYIIDLKNEIVSAKSGMDFDFLLSDE